MLVRVGSPAAVLAELAAASARTEPSARVEVVHSATACSEEHADEQSVRSAVGAAVPLSAVWEGTMYHIDDLDSRHLPDDLFTSWRTRVERHPEREKERERERERERPAQRDAHDSPRGRERLSAENSPRAVRSFCYFGRKAKTPIRPEVVFATKPLPRFATAMLAAQEQLPTSARRVLSLKRERERG